MAASRSARMQSVLMCNELVERERTPPQSQWEARLFVVIFFSSEGDPSSTTPQLGSGLSNSASAELSQST
jgi:hypothetical protein